jgi:4-hydroxy-tetrahydrodipicolinate reductase
MKLTVVGVAGRMGQALVRRVCTHPDLVLAAAIARPGSPAVGEDAGVLAGAGASGVPIIDDVAVGVAAGDLIIDFSTPTASRRILDECLRAEKPLVIGTTGFAANDLDAIAEASKKIAIVLAPNMSVGVNLIFKLIEMAARALGDEVDVEVIEAHHRDKVDAPSGTALRMGEILAEVLDRDLEQDAIYGRQGQVGARARSTIGFSSIRGGDIIGEHTVMFAGVGERIELTHRAQSRDNFVTDALRAAMFAVDKDCGLFDMQDVLGLS